MEARATQLISVSCMVEDATGESFALQLYVYNMPYAITFAARRVKWLTHTFRGIATTLQISRDWG